MTLGDKIDMVEGHGTSNPYVFYMAGIPKLCIPSMGEEDGPVGVADGLTGVTALPSGVSLAATFDPGLANRYGRVVGAEEAGKGASVNLGPTVNIDRDPRWGRSFEAYTEDPFLNAMLATTEIDGVQSQRVMSQVKHFDAYNQETYRNTPSDNVIVSDRTLHEIYMPAFQAAIEQAKAASVMCAYSTVNDHYSCQNHYLLTNVLRQEWDFPGFVTSDYGALHSTTGGAFAGTDQEQPFNTYYGQALKSDVQSGTVPPAVINTMVQRILTEMFRFNFIAQPPTGSTSATVTTPSHVAVSNEVAEAGTTLLKNAGGALPLSAGGAGRIAVIGPSASASPTYAGGGSAYVIPSKTVTPLQGLRGTAAVGTHIIYKQGLPTDTALPAIPPSDLKPAYAPTPSGGSYDGTLTAPQTGTYVLAIDNPCGCYTSTYLYLNRDELIDNPSTPPVHMYSVAVHLQRGHKYALHITGQSDKLAWGTPSQLAPGIAKAVAAATSAKTAVVVVSDDTESEATDRPSLDLPSAQNELISRVAAANPHTIVVVNAGAPIAMPWLSKVAGVVDAWYPGQTSGNALAAVLFGEVDPGGHLPVTFPKNLHQVPAHTTDQFPGNGSTVRYSEGIDVGYRWYDAKNITPLFPFGFGLSYTRFEFSGLRVSPQSTDGLHDVRVSAKITNVGKRAGTDVAQLYLGDPASTGEPPRQLVAFNRISLGPGRSARLRFTITPRDTWWWDHSAPGGSSTGGGWSQTGGRYGVYVGDSSALANLPLRGTFSIPSTSGARQVVVHAPDVAHPGKTARVKVTVTASGTETLDNVSLALQVPQGWTVKPVGSNVFGRVRPSAAPTATFTVRPPSYWPNSNAVVHATAQLGPAATREGGVTVRVS
ncbi:MAG: glycoside hydrolase family 3 C-terminal domain-containing protein [Solirubrobacterales bacterium]|nr:glycoside hydrolase family 3 C-terminal domain-containing protein [Solirubrobacterales bacterium]